MRYFCLVFLMLFTFPCVYGQVAHDDCFSALFIPDVTSYCSGANAFDNTGALASPEQNPSCWPDGTATHDLWFTFSAPQTGLLIQLTGATDRQRGTLNQPSLAVYEGTCSTLSLIGCSSVQEGQDNVVELNFTDLIVGQIYYLRVDGRNNTTGSFELCTQSFIPVPTPESDCIRSVVLCDKSSFFINNLGGVGQDRQEITNTCINEEFASVWYTWTAATSGTLTFTLTPNNEQDDLDFVVFQLPDGLRNCTNRLVLRCMASGETVGAPLAQNLPCMGPTGLREGAGDTQEVSGCQPGDDNFLAPLNMEAGETYALIVNNYSRSGFGFRIDFGGSGTFLGPEPDFEILANQGLECNKTIEFVNQSASLTDSIVGWSWNFGEGASPMLSNGPGPHEVVYESFGPKITALTIESSKGCRVSKIIDIDVAPCCPDTTTLDVKAAIENLSCFQSNDGVVELTAEGGQPRYLYSVDGLPFQPGGRFENLDAGAFTVAAQDRKGCEISKDVQLVQPLPIELFLTSAEDTVILGFGTRLFSDFIPADRNLTYDWTPPTGLSCTDCPNPEVIPPGNTTYILQVTDQDGCTGQEEIDLFTIFTRPYFAPTAIMPSSGFGNARFKLELNIAAERIEYLTVYDRWGNQMYSVEDISPDDPGYQGWDGNLNGLPVNPGVFVWVAKVRFIDGEEFIFTGDFTVFY